MACLFMLTSLKCRPRYLHHPRGRPSLTAWVAGTRNLEDQVVLTPVFIRTKRGTFSF